MRCSFAAGLGLMAFVAAAGTASAVEYTGMDANLYWHGATGVAATVPTARGSAPRYENVTNFQGNAFAGGGAAAAGGGAFITRMVMDDITPTGGAGADVDLVVFSVANLNATPVTVRPRLRFWFNNGAGGSPGTTYSAAATPVGFTFNPLVIAPGVNLFNFAPAPGTFTLPGGTFWAGMTFDSVDAAGTGNTGATVAQMNNIGQGLFNPPGVGSSADNIFTTNAAGSFFGTQNPAGAQGNFGGVPFASLGWEFDAVPTPGALSLFGLAGLAASRRRR